MESTKKKGASTKICQAAAESRLNVKTVRDYADIGLVCSTINMPTAIVTMTLATLQSLNLVALLGDLIFLKRLREEILTDIAPHLLNTIECYGKNH